jgi:hypothetical protein
LVLVGVGVLSADGLGVARETFRPVVGMGVVHKVSLGFVSGAWGHIYPLLVLRAVGETAVGATCAIAVVVPHPDSLITGLSLMPECHHRYLPFEMSGGILGIVQFWLLFVLGVTLQGCDDNIRLFGEGFFVFGVFVLGEFCFLFLLYFSVLF